MMGHYFENNIYVKTDPRPTRNKILFCSSLAKKLVCVCSKNEQSLSFLFGFEYLGKINFLVEAILEYESGEKVLDNKKLKPKI
jgi:hypothetical protein